MTSDVESLQYDLRRADDAVNSERLSHQSRLDQLQKNRDAVAERLQRAQTRERLYEVECPLSKRVDGKLHSWRWDGDDPHVVCAYCGEIRDSLSGRVIIAGRRAVDADA